MTWPDRPVIYEVNTAVWLSELSREQGRRVTFADVPSQAWDAITPSGVDAVWFMGVWQRSPAGLAVARRNDELMNSFRDALLDLTDADIIGSPYCVRGYIVDESFGGPEALAVGRVELAERGCRLVLDYVPNHVAPDHPWVSDHPERFIRGTAAEAADDPQAWTTVGSGVLAHGRDPYFPPWPDVVQLNAYSPDLRAASAATITEIAGQCDGIRCDMAMLMTNTVFGKTWAGWSGPEPVEEFWPLIIGLVRQRHPDVLMLAEAYWDMEWELQHEGFDFCYDKRLYDRLVEGGVQGVRDHLRADLAYQARLVRFLENHDEPRAAATFARDAERAAAVAIATIPGATLWHEGEFEARQVRPPVFLARRPDEELDLELAAWHLQLIATVTEHHVRSGEWRLLEATGWPDNQTCQNVLAWAWENQERGGRHVIVVNWSGAPAQGRLPLPWPDLRGSPHMLRDLLAREDVDRDGDELVDPGLFVALPAWGAHLFEVT